MKRLSPSQRLPSVEASPRRHVAGRGYAEEKEGIEQPKALTYEDRLSRDLRWALSEGSRHFEENSAVFTAMHKITKRLRELGIPYAVVGGMALFKHGLRRFTEDVDLLVTREDLKKVHENLDGLGYIPPHRLSKQLRDTELGVRIEFLVTGDYPGDGKKKPVAFPDPRAVSTEHNGINYLNLPTLIELKLASGMTNPNRMKDLTDVIELIKVLELPANLDDQLAPYVRVKYREIHRQARKRFVTLWRNKGLTVKAKTIEEMISLLRGAAQELEHMKADGVFLDADGGVAGDNAKLVTTDPNVAKKYDMIDEVDYKGAEEENEDEGNKDGKGPTTPSDANK